MKGKLLRLAITISLLALVLSRVDWGEFRRVGADVPLQLLLAGYFLNLGMVALNTWRWRVLVRPLGVPVGFFRLASYYFVCMFFNNFMPTSIGGDVMRVLDLARHTGKRSAAMASILVERLLGLYVLLPVSVAAFLLLYPILPERRSFFIAELVMAALFFAGTLMIRKKNLQRIEPLLRPVEPLLARFDVRRRASELYEYLGAYKNRRGAVLAALLLSLLSRSVWIVSCRVFAAALGIELSLTHFFLLMPLVEVGRMLPLSLAGVGIREGVMLLVLRLFGVSDTKAVFLALLIYGIFILNGLIGGLIYGLRGFAESGEERGDGENGAA